MLHSDHLHTDPAYRDALREAQLSRVSDALSRVSGRIAAWSRTTDTIRVSAPGRPVGFYLKRYYYPRWKNRLRGMLRGTLFGTHRARAEFDLLRSMLQMGIPAVRPVAYGVRRLGPFVTACYLVTEETPGAVNLTTFATRAAAEPQGERRGLRRLAATRLARLVAEMHAAGFTHGQLFWRNILVRPDANGEPEFFLLDARPRRRGHRLRGVRRRWVTELGQLAASALPFTTATLRWRFLREYLGPDARRGDLIRAATAILRQARRWKRHESQRIRMNSRFSRWSAALSAELERDDGAARALFEAGGGAP